MEVPNAKGIVVDLAVLILNETGTDPIYDDIPGIVQELYNELKKSKYLRGAAWRKNTYSG